MLSEDWFSATATKDIRRQSCGSVRNFRSKSQCDYCDNAHVKATNRTDRQIWQDNEETNYHAIGQKYILTTSSSLWWMFVYATTFNAQARIANSWHKQNVVIVFNLRAIVREFSLYTRIWRTHLITVWYRIWPRFDWDHFVQYMLN